MGKMIKRALGLLAVAGFLLGLAGCKTVDERDTNIPWSQPKDWEQQAPGMPPLNSGRY